MVELADDVVLFLESSVGGWFAAVKHCHQNQQPFFYVIFSTNTPKLFQEIELLKGSLDANDPWDWNVGDFIMNSVVESISWYLDTEIPMVTETLRPPPTVFPLIPKQMVTVCLFHSLPPFPVSS